MLILRSVLNVFFIIITIVSFIPSISAANPFSVMMPLIFVVFFSALRELTDDYRRSKSDKKVNKVKYRNITKTGSEKIKSLNIKTGFIIELNNNQRVPCDGIPIYTSNEEGSVFIETSEIDGETNLKQKEVPLQFQNIVQSDLCNIEYSFSTELPNSNLTEFKGVFVANEEKFGVNITNFVPQGSVIRNTNSIYMFCVFCGMQSKTSLSIPKQNQKHSTMSSRFNKFVLVAMVFDIFLVILSSILCYYYNYTIPWYINSLGVSLGIHSIKRAFTFLNLFAFLVPLATNTHIEFFRLFVTLVMNNDEDMKIKVVNKKGKVKKHGMKVNSSLLLEELGMVQFMVTDKTGTLTENVMKLKKCGISNEQFSVNQLKDILFKNTSFNDNNTHKIDDICGVTSGIEMLKIKNENSVFNKYCEIMAMCNEVFPWKENEDVTNYQSSSPDEITLCETAQRYGFELKKRSNSQIVLKVMGTDEKN
ncbi:Phospholipid-transporting P-type ATPase [Entamoeba marina]